MGWIGRGLGRRSAEHCSARSGPSRAMLGAPTAAPGFTARILVPRISPSFAFCVSLRFFAAISATEFWLISVDACAGEAGGAQAGGGHSRSARFPKNCGLL